MNSLLVFSVVLWIHIFFGVIALFVAPAAMLTRKGGLWHRRWGKMYLWSITVVAALPFTSKNPCAHQFPVRTPDGSVLRRT